MRLALTLSLLAVGCTEDPPRGPAIDSHVEYYDLPASIAPKLDLLIVLDHTTAMASYQTGLSALPAAIASMLTGDDGPQADARVAVTSVDGTGVLRIPSTTTDTYVALGYDVRYQRAANFTGPLTDALTQLLAVGASGSGATLPLASAKAALDTNGGFLRSNAALGVVTITATDDASSLPVIDYATSLKARKVDPALVAVASTYDLPATRLDAFQAAFPNRSSTLDITTADLGGESLGVVANLLKSLLGVPCPVEPADVDAATPGAQYDCDLSVYYDDNTSEAVRQCKADSTGPCFRFEADPQTCMTQGTARFYLDGFPTRWHPAVRGQCVVTGQN